MDPGSIWVFEQEQSLALSGVSTTIRMTVVRLKSGGLFVYSPVAPTRYVCLGSTRLWGLSPFKLMQESNELGSDLHSLQAEPGLLAMLNLAYEQLQIRMKA